MQSAMVLSVVETQSVLIPTGLLIMRAHCIRPRALPAGDCLAPFRVHALDAMLSVKKSAVGNGSSLLGLALMAAVVAT